MYGYAIIILNPNIPLSSEFIVVAIERQVDQPGEHHTLMIKGEVIETFYQYKDAKQFAENLPS